MADLHRERIQPQGVPELGADGGQVQKKSHLWYLQGWSPRNPGKTVNQSVRIKKNSLFL